jgi:hypothetical protein
MLKTEVCEGRKKGMKRVVWSRMRKRGRVWVLRGAFWAPQRRESRRIEVEGEVVEIGIGRFRGSSVEDCWGWYRVWGEVESFRVDFWR